MKPKFYYFFVILSVISWQFCSCNAQNASEQSSPVHIITNTEPLKTGAERLDQYIPLLHGKRVAMLVNQTSIVPAADGSQTPLIDSLINLDVDVRFLMAPEHGFKGSVSAGDAVGDSHYEKRKNLQVYSLYGKNKKPQAEWLNDADCVIFDIQDVGCRFYTYLSTLYYLLEACGENDKEVIVLDRPNPHDTIDGPILDLKCKSFVGMIEVPLLHGCTLGELAKMMIGEGWIKHSQTGEVLRPKLTVIPCSGWHHGDAYSLPVAPSPNLRTDHAIRIYPSLCLFEATDISVGRGTDWPFEVLGHPQMKGDFEFTPVNCTSATHPLQENKLCRGFDLRNIDCEKGFHLRWLLACHQQFTSAAAPTSWIKQNRFFDRLAGTDQLRLQIASGLSESEIRESWQPALIKYRGMRQKYSIYK